MGCNHDPSSFSIFSWFDSVGTTVQSLAHCCIDQKNVIWGVAMLDSEDNIISVVELKREVNVSVAESLSCQQYALHVILGGDIKFLHTVLGLQSCRATYPCFACLVQLDDFAKGKVDFRW